MGYGIPGSVDRSLIGRIWGFWRNNETRLLNYLDIYLNVSFSRSTGPDLRHSTSRCQEWNNRIDFGPYCISGTTGDAGTPAARFQMRGCPITPAVPCPASGPVMFFTAESSALRQCTGTFYGTGRILSFLAVPAGAGLSQSPTFNRPAPTILFLVNDQSVDSRMH